MKYLSQQMRIIFCLGLAWQVFAGQSAAWAEADGKPLRLTVDEAVRMAFEASEDLKMQDNEIARSRAKYVEERADMLPQINGTGTWSNQFEHPDISATAGLKEYSLDAGLSVNQTLFTFGKLSAAVASAGKAVEVSRFNKEVTRQEVIYNAKLAYYSACLTKQTFEIAQESHQNAVQNKEILHDRSAGGRVSKHDNIKISADIAARLPVVNNARAEYHSALETLKVAIGLESPQEIELAQGFDADFPELERESLALALYNNQPVIKALAKAIEVNKDIVISKRAEYLPEIAAFATWNHKGYGDDYDVGQDNLYDYGVAGVKIDVPIWTGGETHAELQQARIDKRNAELDYQKGKETYLLELDKSLAEYREYVKTLAAHEEAVRWARESFDYSQELFRSGRISITDLNDAEWQLTNEKMNRVMTLFNLHKTLAKIERLTLTENNHE